MKKFSKLLAVLVTLAVIICPMTSAIVANATTTGSYSIVADTANDVVLTIHSDDGFVVYQATVTFNSDSSFVNNYSSDGYTNGLKVVDYAMVDAAKDEYNAPAISAQQNGASLVLLVSATNGANMDLYKEIQIGIRVQSGTTANLSNIKAADDGDVTVDPTLLNFGSKVNSSTGDVTIDNNPNATTGESHTHDFQMTNTVVATPATCNTPVQYYKVCSICGATGDTYGGDTYADHTPTVQARDAAHLASAATCTADATYYYGCAVCGTVVKENKQGYTGTWTDTGTATNHANKVYNAASAATCTATGNTAYYYCPDCGKYFSDAACTIEIANNSWVTPMTSHTASNTETYLKTAATCTDNAIYFQTCSVCGAKLDTTWVKAGTATGHSFTSYTYNNDATCTAAGTETATCANGCGTTDTRTSAEHPALGHDWVAGTVTAPTCTEAGNTHYTCSRCDATKDEAIAATGHTEETIPAVAPTCTTAGATAGVKCSVCNEILTAPTPIAALGHNMTPHAASAATCTAAGNSAYWSCDRCNKFFSDAEGNTEIAENSWVIAATGHTPVTDAAVAATCVATGLTEGSHCSVCNAVLVAQTETPIDPTNHTNIVDDAAVAATCTETGLTAGSHCADCSAVIVAQETVNALGHNFETYTYNNDATCTAAGTKTATCTRCDATDTVADPEHPALGHDWQVASVTPATCTEAGNTHYTCSRCDATKDEPIAATGHNMTPHAAVAATCTTAGNSAYWSCDRCNKYFSDAEGNTEIEADSWVISALGHDYQYEHISPSSPAQHIVTCSRCDYETTELCDTAGDEGACSKCGYLDAEIVAVEDDTLVFMTPSPSYMSTGIQINFRVRNTVLSKYADMEVVVIPDKYDMTTLNRVANPSEIVTRKSALASAGSAAKQYTYTDITLYELGLNVNYMLRAYDASGNFVAYSPVYSTSVEAYLRQQISSTSDENAKRMYIDTLVVCDEVMKNVAANHAGSDLATDYATHRVVDDIDLTQGSTSISECNTVDQLTSYSVQFTKESTAVHQVRTSVTVEKVPYITLRIKDQSQGLDLSKLAITVTYTSVDKAGSHPYSRTFTGSDFTRVGNNRFIEMKFAEVGLHDSNKTITFACSYDGVDMFALDYSLETYESANISNATTGDMLSALIKLGQSFRTYQGLD